MTEFFYIFFRSIKLDKSFYADNKNFGEASIYYSIIIIFIISIVGTVPASALSKITGNFFVSEGPPLRQIIFVSYIVWIMKTAYLYFVGVVMFPSKLTKCNFRKLLVTVAYAHCPFIFYILIFDISYIYLTFVIYLWYCLTLIVGMRQVLNYENYLKPTIISLAPQFILLIYLLSIISKINSGTIS
tara:strand:- start:732 stop:1289 length:558 start_codon:yes stop_codon:yes gene_type:complete